MPARKSSPPKKPAKPAAKKTAAPHIPSEGQDKPARLKAKAKPATKTAPPAKKAATTRKPGGAAASGPRKQPAKKAAKATRPPAKRASTTTPPRGTTAAEILARKPAPDPEAMLTPDDEAFITEYLRNGQNGTAAWRALHPKTSPEACSVSAHRALRRAKVSERLASERARLASAHELDRDKILDRFAAIAKADPNDLVQMRHVACSECWGGVNPEEARPTWMEPDPDCDRCGGEGHATEWAADTRKLSPAARALYAGVHRTKDGIRILMHDQLGALKEAARIVGAYEKDNAQAGKSAADALREMFAGLHSAHKRAGPMVAGLSIIPAADAEPQGLKGKR